MTFPNIPSQSRLDTARPITQSLLTFPVLVRPGDAHISRFAGRCHGAKQAKRIDVRQFSWRWNGSRPHRQHLTARSVPFASLLNALDRMGALERELHLDRLRPVIDHESRAVLDFVLGENDPTSAAWVNEADGNGPLLERLTHDIAEALDPKAAAAWVRSWCDPLPDSAHNLHTSVAPSVRNELAGIAPDDPWADSWRNPAQVDAFRHYGLTPDDLEAFGAVAKWTGSHADYAGAVALTIERGWTAGRTIRLASSTTSSKPRGHRPSWGQPDLLPRLEAFASLLDDDLTITDATAWVAAGARGVDAAATRRTYLDLGFDLETAGPWMDTRLSVPDAVAWRDAGADPKLAYGLWHNVKVRDADAAGYASTDARYAVSAWQDLLDRTDARDLRALRCAALVDRADVLGNTYGPSMTQRRDRIAQLVADLYASGEDLDAVQVALTLVKPQSEQEARDALGLHRFAAMAA